MAHRSEYFGRRSKVHFEASTGSDNIEAVGELPLVVLVATVVCWRPSLSV